MIPKTKPQIVFDKVKEILDANGCDLSKVNLVGIRGYYLNEMGKSGQNDRGVYDDALIWFGPKMIFSFNANCDASRYRKGWGFGREKGMAMLKSGLWTYKTGIHYGSIPHAAFRQAAEVTVARDGSKGQYDDTGWFGINIHRGGSSGTSSLGCQTLPPVQWDLFKKVGYQLLDQNKQKTFTYCLIEETRRRQGLLRVPGL